MADIERIKRDIAEIAQRPRAVRFEEITRIVRQLKRIGWSTREHKGKETWIFYVGGEKFTVCEHNPGRQHIKMAYVHNFLRAMINLELYEED